MFFGNSQQAFIEALKPRTCCISETRYSDSRVSLLSGNYLKGLIFWKRDSFFSLSLFFKRQISVLVVPWKYPYSSFYASWSMTPPTSHRPATPAGVNFAAGSDPEFLSLHGLWLRDAHARPQTRCVWRQTPLGWCSHMEALKQSKREAVATLGKYNISRLTLPSHVFPFGVEPTLSHPVSGHPDFKNVLFEH